MNFPKKEKVDEIRKKYPVGTKIALVSMNDFQAIDVGTKGIVTGVDDIGTVHVSWENGRSLGVCLEEDEIEILTDDGKDGE